MEIKFWGTRGSLPTPGHLTTRYGGNTTCVEVRLKDGTLIIIDAGSGIRLLGKSLMAEKRADSDIHLFLTHAHWDHLMGFPFFIPGYVKGNRIHVRGGPNAKRSLEKYLAHQMDPPYFPLDFENLQAEFTFTSGEPQKKQIGSAEIIPIPLSHPNGGYGCKIIENGRSFVFLTDNELLHRHAGGLDEAGYVDACLRADLLVHDAQYTEEEYKAKKTWGHSTFSQAVILAVSAKVKRLGLFHHDPERTDDDLDKKVDMCKAKLNQEGKKIECFGIREGMKIAI